ncbi:hypothetical protein M409DRAFT_20525 [Zasmidium cellare ATCC 36951]|uniref:NAD(P)-binding domain-containing protein n=1 Tax=Zasmidium cellare ATCC 36951 TaxID=1080233 RepID=A0A6A6CU29_ZASCE|nr:uncharacterized protein M409DRAFT_20525 [Zasmidium cellare ATCC 36951]KAF2169299.1 hypothetical protein M409DRAFT_20525 [Zasmidium cellare ATCC 36951]
MSIPIVVLGMTGSIGARVTARLKPEYDTIQFITSIARAKSEISTLQAGKSPPSDTDNVGSHNFSQRPQAVIFGRAYSDEAVEELRQHCGGSESGLAWVLSTKESRNRAAKAFPYGGDQDAFNRYADKTTAVTKSLLDQLKREGKLGKDGVYHYGE